MNLEHTKAVEQKATAGPWVASVVDSPRSTVSTAIYSHAHPAGSAQSEVLPSYLVKPGVVRMSRADAEFIVHARTVVPVLVAAVERVQALHSCTRSLRCEECELPYPCPTIEALTPAKESHGNV